MMNANPASVQRIGAFAHAITIALEMSMLIDRLEAVSAADLKAGEIVGLYLSSGIIFGLFGDDSGSRYFIRFDVPSDQMVSNMSDFRRVGSVTYIRFPGLKVAVDYEPGNISNVDPGGASIAIIGSELCFAGGSYMNGSTHYSLSSGAAVPYETGKVLYAVKWHLVMPGIDGEYHTVKEFG